MDRGGNPGGGEAPGIGTIRDEVYNEVVTRRWFYGHRPASVEDQLERMAGADNHWASLVARGARRIEALARWTEDEPAPERWRLLEAWSVRAHGPQMAAAGGFRLAFYSEERHGARLDRALTRYGRHSRLGAPSGWPTSPTGGFAAWVAHQVHYQDGASHGIAADIARFDAFTKDVAAYAHYRSPDYLRQAQRRALRRQARQAVADQINQRLSFRTPTSTAARLRTARELLDSDHAPHRRFGAAVKAGIDRELRLENRDRALAAGRPAGNADGRAIRAWRHAERWDLPDPTADAKPC